MLSSKKFSSLKREQRIAELECNGVYLMQRFCNGFGVLLYSLDGSYIEVWQNQHFDICSVQCIGDEEAVNLYLNDLSIEIA